MQDTAHAGSQTHTGMGRQSMGIFRFHRRCILATQNIVLHRLGGDLTGIGVQQRKQLGCKFFVTLFQVDAQSICTDGCTVPDSQLNQFNFFIGMRKWVMERLAEEKNAKCDNPEETASWEVITYL